MTLCLGKIPTQATPMRLENPEKKQGKSIIDFPLFCHKANHNGFEEKKHQEKGCRWVL
jgi:hypothetical protein